MSGTTFIAYMIPLQSIYKYTKSVEPYLCLFSLLRFLQDPTDKNKQATPTPNMKCHQTEQSTCGRSVGGIVISQRAFTAFLFWVGEILQDFKRPKQALINALIICPQNRLLDFTLQSYYIFLIFANLLTQKYIKIRHPCPKT